MIPASLILFAIQAGVQLGRKSYEIMVDKDFQRPLVMPRGDIVDETAENEAKEFFQNEENRKLGKPGGPLHPFYELRRKERDDLKAYRAYKASTESRTDINLGGLDLKLEGPSSNLLPSIENFEQTKNQIPKTGQRLLATVIDIGIDFFKTNTAALGLGSSAEKIITAFVPVVESVDAQLELDEREFDARQIPNITSTVLTAGLRVLGDNTALISRDQGVQSLLGGITLALADDFDTFKLDFNKKNGRMEFYDRVTSSLLRGAMAGFSENPTLFIRGKSGETDFIRATLNQVFQGLQTQEDLFTNESLEIIFKNALLTVSERSDFITSNKIIQSFLQGTINELVNKPTSKDIFSEGTVADIMKIGLETLGNNISTLIDPDNPERLFLNETVAALATGLSATLTDGKLGKLFTTKQMIALSRMVFQEVARNPEHLLGFENKGKPEETVLAQIIASVANSLGEEPRKLITGEGALALLHTAIQTGMQNADKLLRRNTPGITDNLLYQLLKETVQPLAEKLTQGNVQSLINRQVIAETATRMLVTTANNLEPFLNGKATLIRELMQIMLESATANFATRLNAGNFAVVFEMLLRKLLLGRLDLTKKDVVITALQEVLNSLI